MAAQRLFPHCCNSLRDDTDENCVVQSMGGAKGVSDAVSEFKSEYQAKWNAAIALLRKEHDEFLEAIDALVLGHASPEQVVLTLPTYPATASPPDSAPSPRGSSHMISMSEDFGMDEDSEAEQDPTAESKNPRDMPRARSEVGKNAHEQHPAVKRMILESMSINDSPDVPAWRRCFQKIMACPWFEPLIGIVITINAVLIGIEIELEAAGNDGAWMEYLSMSDAGFLLFYVLEAVIRIVADGPIAFRDGWFIFDFVCVAVGVVGWIIAAVAMNASTATKLWESILVVRMFRLLRLLRTLRVLRQFRTMWRMVNGLIQSFETVVATLSLLLLILYMFGCVGMEIISSDAELRNSPDGTIRNIIDYNFGSLGRTMLTLAQFVTLDSVASVYTPLIYERPLLLGYFLLLMLFVSISLMNLVTAALVESALEHATLEKDIEKRNLRQKIKRSVPKLIELFHSVDVDGSGFVTRDELATAPQDLLPHRIWQTSSCQNMLELFDMLDVDGTGWLTQEEFVGGVVSLFILDIPVSTMQVLKTLRLLREGLDKLSTEVTALRGHRKKKPQQTFTA